MSDMKLAKSMVITEMAIALLSGVFAAVNHSAHGLVAVTVVFAFLAGAAALASAVMASLLWLFALPAGETR